MNVWVTWAHSESGDDYGPCVLAKKPTKKKLEAFWREYAPGDFSDENDGPGNWGSWLYVSLEERTVIE
jgi:hypothetical protein